MSQQAAAEITQTGYEYLPDSAILRETFYTDSEEVF